MTTWYLDSSATGAANGTSWTDAYTTLAAWNTASAGVLSAPGILKVRGNIISQTAIVNLSGWTTDATNTLTIEADIADMHVGVLSASKPGFKMTGSAYNGGTIAVVGPAQHVIFRNLQFQNALSYGGSAAASSVTATATTAGFVKVENCLFAVTTFSASAPKGLNFDDSSTTWYVKNCVFYDYTPASGTAVDDSSGSSAYIYNCTFQNCTMALRGHANHRIRNCVFQDCTTDLATVSHTTTNYNLTSAASFPGSAANNVLSTTLTFLDKTANDFHLAAGDTAARGAGIGPTSDAEVPTTDVDGTARSGTTTDIGFDLYVSAASPKTIRPATIIKSQRATMSGS